MFTVNGTTISLSRGDTGAIRITANAKYRGTDTPYVFGERDRALFTIRGNGKVVKQKAYPIVQNKFTVVFANADTDQIGAGSYSWDVRYVINPKYENGVIVDGDQVITPLGPQQANLLSVVGEI